MIRKIAVIWMALLMLLNFVMVVDVIVNFTKGENNVVNSGFDWVNPLPTANFLKSGAWKPDGEYALIVGSEGTVLKYDGKEFYEMVSIQDCSFFDIAWNPDGSYALLVGRSSLGAVIKYDGSNFIPLNTSFYEIFSVAWKPNGSCALLCGGRDLFRYDGNEFKKIETGVDKGLLSISWKPDASYALVVGRNGTILKCDGSNVSKVSTEFDKLLTDVSWKKDGSSALIACYSGAVLEYDEISIKELESDDNFNFGSVAWNPNGTCALLVGYDKNEHLPLVQKYNGIGFTTLQNPYGNESFGSRLEKAFWKTDDYALIVGYCGRIMKYNGVTLTSLSIGSISTELNDVAWKPDGSYAVILNESGGSIWKYDGFTIIELEIPNSIGGCGLNDITWKPDGSYALIVGGCGIILKYDGNEITSLNSQVIDNYVGVAWHPNEDYALIVGFFGTILKYDGLNFTKVIDNTSLGLEDVAWKPDGSYALIIGQDSVILKYDGNIITEEESAIALNFTDVSWKSDGEYALIVGYKRGDFRLDSSVIKYDDNSYNILKDNILGLSNYIEWDIEGKNAYILVSGDIITFDGNDFQTMQTIHRDVIEGMDWKPDGSYALIVGHRGNVLKYAPDLPSGIPLINLRSTEEQDDGNGNEYDVQYHTETPIWIYLYVFILILTLIILFFILILTYHRKRRERRKKPPMSQL